MIPKFVQVSLLAKVCQGHSIQYCMCICNIYSILCLSCTLVMYVDFEVELSASSAGAHRSAQRPVSDVCEPLSSQEDVP